MGRELQKKKKRSSIPKIKMKPKSKRVNPLGNPIIAANWYVSPLLISARPVRQLCDGVACHPFAKLL